MSPHRKHRNIYYGWIIVGVSFLVGATQVGAFQSILAVFLKPMADSFGWSRTVISGTMVFGSLFGGCISPFIGPILDKRGPRIVAFVSVLVLSSGLVSLAFMHHVWQLYLFFGVGRIVAVGALTLVVSVTISNWFIRKRGRAMGIAWLGPRLGMAVLPALAQYFIMTQGWRFAWAALGVLVFAISGLPSLIFLRRRPEDLGLLPDGDARKTAPYDAPTSQDCADDPLSALKEEPIWTRRQVIRNHTFRLLIITGSIFPLVQGATNFHMFPFLTDQGISETVSIMLISTFALSGCVGTLSCGFLADKFGSKPILIINGFASGIVFLAFYLAVTLGSAGTGWITIMFILQALNGILHGGRMPLLTKIWADYFGRRSLGRIQGLSNPFRFGTNAIGPILTALCFDLFQSYAIPFYSFIGLFFVSGLVTLYLPTPRLLKPPQESDI